MFEKYQMTNTDLLIFKNGPTKVKCIIIIKTIDINKKIQNNGIVYIFMVMEMSEKLIGIPILIFYFYKNKIIVII